MSELISDDAGVSRTVKVPPSPAPMGSCRRVASPPSRGNSSTRWQSGMEPSEEHHSISMRTPVMGVTSLQSGWYATQKRPDQH